ncbi:hypothetical protein GCM10023318_21690 [Nocardia callitridis]|uniref:Uncharacterized protein n=1 Tax=Nocardia callitridis TaxID=648753 RepID=A0ABP9K418_9NOCA
MSNIVGPNRLDVETVLGTIRARPAGVLSPLKHSLGRNGTGTKRDRPQGVLSMSTLRWSNGPGY